MPDTSHIEVSNSAKTVSGTLENLQDPQAFLRRVASNVHVISMWTIKVLAHLRTVRAAQITDKFERLAVNRDDVCIVCVGTGER